MAFPVEPHVLAAFCLASLVLLVIPGPTIIMVITQALAYGRKTAFASAAGVGLGDLMASTLSTIGAGAILAASATAFLAVKWIGAAYLVWIGVKMWRAPVTPLAGQLSEESDAAMRWTAVFRDAFLVTLFNPKGIVFFMAFVPQFMDAGRPFAPQAAVFIAAFTLLGIVNAVGYVMLASSARQAIRKPRVLRIATRAGASFLIGAGFASLLARRAA